MHSLATVDAFVSSLEVDHRRVADGEWGLSLEAAGWPLHIGIAWRDGLLRIQAQVLEPDALSDHELLFRNRGVVLVRYAHDGSGAVYVMAELPEDLLTPLWLDRVLGMVVDAAIVARQRAQAGSRAPS